MIHFFKYSPLPRQQRYRISTLTKLVRTHALELGVKDFVTKSFDRTEIQLGIHNILEVRQLYEEKQQHNRLLHSIVAFDCG